MSEITTPRELLIHELGDILYVERQLASEALPKPISEVQDDRVPRGPRGALEETRGHVSNVERVFEMLGEEPSAEKCLGFEGLKAEHDQMLEETSRDLIDSVDLGEPRGQRTTRSPPTKASAAWQRPSERTRPSTSSTPT